MRFKITAFALIFALSACVSPPAKTLEQLDADLARNEKASVRLYPKKSPEEVRKASQKVLQLLDPSDMTFDVRSNELLATRFSMFYAVLNVMYGRNWYSVSLIEDKNGTLSKFGIAGTYTMGPFASRIPESFRSNIPVGAKENVADFKLFHDRVEYILGLRDSWSTCEFAKKAQETPDSLMALCDDMGLENNLPNNIK